jgi:subtilisin family serine protease
MMTSRNPGCPRRQVSRWTIRLTVLLFVALLLTVGLCAGPGFVLAQSAGVVTSGSPSAPVRIVVKLAPDTSLIANGHAVPNDQRTPKAEGQTAGLSADRVTALVSDGVFRDDLSGLGLRQSAAVSALGIHVLELPAGTSSRDAIAHLQLQRGVLWAEEVQPVYASLVPNDPYYHDEWSPARIGLPSAWNVTTGSPSITIAVIDTGLAGTITDFAGRVVDPYSVVDGSPSWPYWNDTYGHGTAVAGVAASQGNNGVGMAGTAWGVSIMPVKISSQGSSDDVTLAQGVLYAVDHGADVINISFGGPGGSSTMQSAINTALSRGVVVVASAGNSGYSASGNISYPAAYPGVISVGATDSADAIASFSSTGSALALSAPGAGILSWNPAAGTNALSYWDGTSFSSPLVAGVAALMLSANPSLTPTQVKDLLEQTALDLGSPGPDQYFGHGRVRADAAVAAAVALATTTTTSGSTTTTLAGGTARYEQTAPAVKYAGTWSTSSATSYSGGSMKYTSTSGASATVSFTGTGLTWIARTGSQYGKAQVTLDGNAPIIVDLYGASAGYQTAVWNTGVLFYGTHTVKIAYTGRKNPASTYTYIDVDAFDVYTDGSGSPVTTTTTTTATTEPVTTTTTSDAPTTTTQSSTTTTSGSTTTTLPGGTARYEQTDPSLKCLGTWTTSSASLYSGGSMKYTSSAGASVTVAFTGTGLTWIARTGSQYGKAQVTLDANTPVIVDLYSSSAGYRTPVWNSGVLSSGTHTVKIAYTGQKNPASTYTYVDVDAFDVRGTLASAVTMGIGGVTP